MSLLGALRGGFSGWPGQRHDWRLCMHLAHEVRFLDVPEGAQHFQVMGDCEQGEFARSAPPCCTGEVRSTIMADGPQRAHEAAPACLTN